MINKKYLWDVFKKISLCRNFELDAFKYLNEKKIKIPTYLSAGQESISASLAVICENIKVKPLIFAQHRCHSTYLSFGGSIDKLILELLGSNKGCSYGMGGSASIHSEKIQMYGHDGHMGTQVPIGTGACFESKKPTLVFMGDASAEEDYVLGALGWASTKKLPMLFIVEDNNLSILTEKKIRRNWHIHKVAKSFNMKGYNISDNPLEIKKYEKYFFKEPMLLNINTKRLFWHAGAGIDSNKTFDRFKLIKKSLGPKAEIKDNKNLDKMKRLWKRIYEKQ